MPGYIKINRKILDWEWYKNLNTCRLFFHILLKANWKDGKFEGKDVLRGSFITSIKRLSLETGLTENEVRTALSHLVKTGEITKQTTKKYTIITVNNYELYQDISVQIEKEHQTNHNNGKGIVEKKRDIATLRENIACYDQDCKAVIDYLNFKLGTNYRSSSKDIRKNIYARFKEGHTLEDFYKVIDVKCAEWNCEPKKGEKDMRPYLRPSTLFGKKFEEYLNQKSSHLKNDNRFNNFPQRKYDFDELEQKILDV